MNIENVWSASIMNMKGVIFFRRPVEDEHQGLAI